MRNFVLQNSHPDSSLLRVDDAPQFGQHIAVSGEGTPPFFGFCITTVSPPSASLLKISFWEKDQRPRNTRHKFPCPETVEKTPVLPAAEEKEKAPEKCSPVRESPAADEIVIELPLNDNTLYNVTQEEISEFSALYPAVDILQEYRGMKAWCMSNTQKRKTRNGIKKFINSWLSNAQKQSQSASQPSQRQLPANPFL